MHRMGALGQKDPRYDAVAELARRQHGVVARDQLVAIGLSRRQIEGRVRRKSLHAVHRGVYAVGHLALTRNGRFMAAVLACGDGAALSHLSAAVLWGILEDRGQSIHVTAERQRKCRGVVVHQSPLQGERVRRLGIVVTTPARTIADLQIAGWRVMRIPSMRLFRESPAVAERLERLLTPVPAAPAAPHPR